MRWVRSFLSEHQISVVFLGILAGLFLPGIFRPVHDWNTLLLQVIFFLSALRVNIRDLGAYARDGKMEVLIVLFKLVVLPLAIFLPLQFIAPDWALAYVIMLSAPTGMTIALVADFFHGKTALAIVITIVTSVLAPFSMPFLLTAIVGRDIPIDTFGMLRSLASAILLPFVCAWVVQWLAPRFVKKESNAWRTLSVAAFGLLIASIVSKTTGGETGFTFALSWRVLAIMLASFGAIVALLYGAYRMIYWRTVPERVTIALCMAYVNNTLSLYIADQYFADQHIVPHLIIILLFLNALLPAFKFLASSVIAERNSI